MVKLINKTQVSLTKERTKGEVFPRSSYSHDFPCVPQQLSLVCESWTSISLLLWALREGMLCPSAPFPAELIPCPVFNWVILLHIRFIAREGDSVELRDRESYLWQGEEAPAALPVLFWAKRREPYRRQMWPEYVFILLLPNLATSWPKNVFIFIDELGFLCFFGFFFCN